LPGHVLFYTLNFLNYQYSYKAILTRLHLTSSDSMQCVPCNSV